jgi:uncharacterized protein
MKSQIDRVLSRLRGTREYDILYSMTGIYETITTQQGVWMSKCTLSCPTGCGDCCDHFEPDLMDGEALYLAAWLIENQGETAEKLISGTFTSLHPESEAGCIFFDADSPWHCTVYGGRCLICRLFGYSGDYGKDGSRRWKPCRFYPAGLLESNHPPLMHRQYTEKELYDLFAAVPPAMPDCIEQALSLTPDTAGKTVQLRTAIPAAIRKLLWIMQINDTPEPESA